MGYNPLHTPFKSLRSVSHGLQDKANPPCSAVS